jgi:hypothetical protein
MSGVPHFGWSGLIVSTSWASGLLARCFPAQADDSAVRPNCLVVDGPFLDQDFGLSQGIEHGNAGPTAPLLKPKWAISTHWINAD